MTLTVSNTGYVLCTSKNKKLRPRDWFLVKSISGTGISAHITIPGHKHSITIPKKYLGKRIRIKIEEIDGE